MNSQLLECGISTAPLTEKAASLGIQTDNLSKVEIIRAIQKAEGYQQCFGTSNRNCTHLDCCFREDCLDSKEQAFLSQIKIPRLNYSTIVPWTVIITAQWIEKGIIILPRGLTKYLEGTSTLHTVYDKMDDVLPYYEDTRIVEGMDYYYNLKGIQAGDTVHIQLSSLDPTRIKIYPGWMKDNAEQENPEE